MARNISRRDLLKGIVPAGAALTVAPGLLKASSTAAFYHGVASGDPTQSAVIIWTRITSSQRQLPVSWEVFTDQGLNETIASGVVEATAASDYTVKVDVAGLQPATVYYYRFTTMGVRSDVGRTRTLPVGMVDSFKMGVCSCSNYPAGYFNAYAAMADQPDIDLVVHLGDYIYEYDADGYASADAEKLGRTSEPLHEITRLADYRRRHAQYKTDQNLQKLHSQVAFILSWDDHEIANDGWRAGADNHDTGEGDWHDRKAAAVQAYYEWMPIREPAGGDNIAQWRRFEIGDLGTLLMLETRFSARDAQVDVGRDMRFVQSKFAVDDAGAAVPVDDYPGAVHQGARIETYKQPFESGTQWTRPITDYHRIKEISESGKLPEGIEFKPDMAAFNVDVLDDPQRQLLGATQRQFIQQTLQDSTADKKPWQIIGNQTLLARINTPNFAKKLSELEKENLPAWFKPALGWSRFGMPFGADSWNGYGAEREWLLDQAAGVDANMIVLTGDTHAAWAIDLQPESGSAWRGVELGTTSITSPGLPEALGMEARRLSELLLEDNANLRYSESEHRGYLTLQLTPQQANVVFHRISTVSAKSFKQSGNDKFAVVSRGTGRGIALETA